MDNLQLAKEAEALCSRLSASMWDAAKNQKQSQYLRLEAVKRKAMERYERRYNKLYEQNSDY